MVIKSPPENKPRNVKCNTISQNYVEVFRNYAFKQKGVYFTLSPEKKENYIENAIQRDIKFRNSLKGIVFGMFTVSEYKEYIQNSSNLNKRMMNLLIERLKSQIQII